MTVGELNQQKAISFNAALISRVYQIQTILGNIQVFEWHPSDPAVLVAGLANGQLVRSNLTSFPQTHSLEDYQVLWDLTPHLEGVQKGVCTWDHR